MCVDITNVTSGFRKKIKLQGEIMAEQHFSKNDENGGLEERARTKTILLEAMAGLFASCQRFLSEIREHPYLSDIFSSEDIIQMNLVERSIPEMIRSLRSLRISIDGGNWQEIENSVFQEKMQEMEKKLEETKCFVNEKRQKIPKPNLGFIFFLLFPATTITYHTRKLIHRIRMRRLKKEEGRLVAEREDIERRTKEIREKIKERSEKK